LISISRLAFLPVYLVMARETGLAHAAGDARGEFQGRLFCVAVLVLIWLSDLLDGFVARRFDLTSKAGAILDAIVDKLVQLSLVAYLALDHGDVFPRMPLWFAASVFGRDLVILYGSLRVRQLRGGIDPSHRFHGRLSTGCVLAAILATTMDAPVSWLTPLFLCGALSSLISVIGYIQVGREQVRCLDGTQGRK
ncbi:MAG TPA: CDP-alcohol phosphatidyltransferase family protein, partial [Planctomycetota bacterium]|nr:CDP-alcohol phosphatidyltransferase family protein [Planctomycetota bacterium]